MNNKIIISISCILFFGILFWVIFIHNKPSPKPNISECKIDDDDKIDCMGKSGIDKNTCLKNANCCYNPIIAKKRDGTIVPWCYKKVSGQYNERKASERYYSFGKTMIEGGVIPSVNNLMDSIKGDKNDDGTSPIFKLSSFPFGWEWDGKIWQNTKKFVDWDSNSGMLCGNTWGKPSNMARIIYNLLSLYSDDSILYDMDIKLRRDFLSSMFYNKNTNGEYTQPSTGDWQAQYYSQGPSCKPDVWNYGMIYLHGFMGQTGNNLGLIQSDKLYWFHAGATYGYGCTNLFVPASISGDFKGTLLEGNDIAFNCSNNYNYDDKFTYNVISYICWKLNNYASFYQNKEELNNLLEEALKNTYILNNNLVGTTPTVGYYYIDKNGTSHSDWKTLTIAYNNTGKKQQYLSGTDSFPKNYPFKSNYLGYDIEPSYYFGSGTKPITAMMVANAIYRVTKDKNIWSDFIKWYCGPYIDRGSSIQAVAMKDILPHATSTYFETIGENVGNSVTDTIQNLLTTYIYSSNGCKYKSINKQKCPSNTFDGKVCTPLIKEDQLHYIFMNNVSVYDIACMKAGIPDVDTLGLDTLDQEKHRIHSYGPIEYVSELIGFDWHPGYYIDNNKWKPYSPGYKVSWLPPTMYSSSGYTLLGSFLWFLDRDVGKKQWWEIDINSSFLPTSLENLINFAGTSGNAGVKYMINKGESF